MKLPWFQLSIRRAPCPTRPTSSPRREADAAAARTPRPARSASASSAGRRSTARPRARLELDDMVSPSAREIVPARRGRRRRVPEHAADDVRQLLVRGDVRGRLDRQLQPGGGLDGGPTASATRLAMPPAAAAAPPGPPRPRSRPGGRQAARRPCRPWPARRPRRPAARARREPGAQLGVRPERHRRPPAAGAAGRPRAAGSGARRRRAPELAVTLLEQPDEPRHGLAGLAQHARRHTHRLRGDALDAAHRAIEAQKCARCRIDAYGHTSRAASRPAPACATARPG